MGFNWATRSHAWKLTRPSATLVRILGLQLGHAFSRVETLSAVGRCVSFLALQLGHAFSRVETFAPDSRLGMGRWLQLGHAFSRVETTSAACGFISCKMASIGPRVLTRGNVAVGKHALDPVHASIGPRVLTRGNADNSAYDCAPVFTLQLG